VDVLMERAPQGLEVEQVRAVMLKVEQVEEVHDLHVWSLSAGMVAMSGHVVVVGEGEGVIAELDQLLKKQFGIGHITIQLERSRCGGGCES
jgi:cobalt-zinc-cadmium efflux system protein